MNEHSIIKKALVFAIALAMILSILPAVLHSANATTISNQLSSQGTVNPLSKVDPSLLNSTGIERILVLGTGSSLDLKSGMGVMGVYPIGKYFIASGFSTASQIKELAKNSNILRIVPDVKLNYSQPKNIESQAIQPDLYQARNILGVNQAYNAFGVNGTGVNVAIVDTGTFFGNPNLQNSIARDSSGRPVYMDADGMSLGITGMYFFVNLTAGYPTNWSSNIPLPYVNLPNAHYLGKAFVNNSIVYLPTKGLTSYIYDVNNILSGSGSPFISYLIPENVTLGSTTNYIKPATFNYTYQNYTLKVGIYAFGFLSMPLITDGYGDYLGLSDLWNYGLTVVPTVVIPSINPFTFDTVYITGWNTYLHDLGNPTDPFSFVQWFLNSLEPYHHINDNTIFLSYYYPNYGIYVDFGTIGGNTLIPDFSASSPLFNYMFGAYTGKVISGLTKDGYLYSNLISFDYGEYHGTFTASVVASQGTVKYNLYNNGTYYSLPGIAPGAKIISVPALYIGDVFYGWMWAAGFDFNYTTLSWQYTGNHRAQIESNSWGISEWPILLTGIGYDAMSALEDTLMLPGVMAPNYPGTLFVHAMGNGGPGYGTDTSPGGALIPLTVGASTESNWIRAYGWGVSNKSGQVIAWSDRGPAYTGDIKPDVVAVGAFSWVPASINYYEGLPWLPPGVGIFGGTSQATPMTAGVAALVIQAMNEKGMTFDPIYVKNVIMNTAVDLYNAPYTQGAGQVNAYYAVADVLGNSTVGAFYTTSYATYQNVMSQIYAMLDYWSSMFSPGAAYPANVPMANWFAGYLSPGQSTQNTFTVMNPTNKTLNINIGTQDLVVFNQKSITLNWNTSDPNNGLYSWVRGWNGPYYAGEYINFTKVFGPIPSGTDMIAIEINSPYVLPVTMGTSTFTWPGYITLYVYDWSGATSNQTNYFGQTVPVPRASTMNLVNDAYNWYNTQIVTINMHANPFTMYPLIRTYLYNIGDLSSIYPEIWNLNFTLNVYYLKNEPIPWITFSQNTLTVGPNSTATFTATLNVPNDASNGVYSGFIVLTGSNGFKQLIPSSVAVMTDLNDVNKVYSFGGADKYSSAPLYNNGLMYGMGSLDWRYESGDVRFYYFDVTNLGITGLNIQVVWNDPGTSMDVFVLDPYGMIVGSTVPYLWNYYGGGMFIPSNNMMNGTSLTVPVDTTGIYTIVVHQTNAGGGVWPIKISGIVQTEGLSITGISDYMYGNVNANYEIVSPVPIINAFYRIDNGSNVTLQVNSLTYSSGTISLNLTKLAPGPHTITVTMENSMYMYYSATASFINVGPAPTVSITSPSQNAYVKGSVNITFSVSGSYIQSKSVIVDGITYVPAGNYYVLDTTKLTDGPHTITVMATNMAGYYGSTTETIIVNNNVPYAQFVSPTSGSFVKGTVNVQYLVSGDYIKNVTLMLDNSTINSTFNTASYSDGSHVLKLIVTNEAGTSYTTSEPIYILNTPPTVSITSPVSGSKLNGTITITFTVTGDHVNSVWLYIDSMGFNVTGMNSYTFNTSGLADGNHTIKVVASNFAGSSTGTVTIKTNNQALASAKEQNLIGNMVSQAYYVGLPIGLVVGLLVGIAIGYMIKRGKKGGVKPWQEPPKEQTTEEKKE
jgi:hypothetical protein